VGKVREEGKENVFVVVKKSEGGRPKTKAKKGGEKVCCCKREHTRFNYQVDS
jgi:hypothetical protein